MTALRTTALFTTTLALCAGGVVAGRSASATSRAPKYDVAAERLRRDADIAFYQSHAAADPTGALDQLHLAALYLQRARERGSPQDLSLAETAARTSLGNRREHNSEAWRALALALVGQHKFLAARDAADSLLSTDTAATGARSLLGEILLELGEYPKADTLFTALDRAGADAAVLARTSRWASLRGRSAHARTLLIAAQADARRRADTPAEQIAWYDLRLGELALTTGHFQDASAFLTSAATVVPDDPRIFLAQARLAMAINRPGAALKAAEAAMNAGEDPLAFALASEAQRRLGQSVEADRMFRVFETAIAAAPPSAWHRQWRLALLDRDRQVGEVLAQATEELKVRRDVYGWDLYAWALHHAGRDAEARVAMQEALRWKTEDVLLDAHAAALGVSR